jgi:ribosomal-protein-alanine N-acetyltransferase
MMPKSPDKIEESELFISEAIRQRASRSDLVLVILDKESGQFLGVCGLHARKDSRQPEFGIWLAKAAHRNGYGKEAIRGLRHWAVTSLEVDAFVYPVDKENTASRNIPESMGGVIFAEQKVSTLSGGVLDEVVYRIPIESADNKSEHLNRPIE